MIRSQARKWIGKETKSGELSGCLTTVLDPRGAAAEAYRTLRTNLIYATVDEAPKLVIVTSPGPAEGKSTICANLGVVLAQAGKSTLLIDCDLRRPTMHEIFGLRSARGLVNVVVAEENFEEACQKPLANLDLEVLTAGALPPNPAEFVNSRRLSEFFATVREKFDHVLVDTSPLGEVSDPIILATQGDGVLLTLDARKTRKIKVQRAVRSLTAVGANVLGTVMNNTTTGKVGYY